MTTHWDIIEGQAACSTCPIPASPWRWIHGGQPDALILCTKPKPARAWRGLPDYTLPTLEEVARHGADAARGRQCRMFRLVGISHQYAAFFGRQSRRIFSPMVSNAWACQPWDPSAKVPRKRRMLWQPSDSALRGEFKWQNEGSGYAYRGKAGMVFRRAGLYDFARVARPRRRCLTVRITKAASRDGDGAVCALAPFMDETLESSRQRL